MQREDVERLAKELKERARNSDCRCPNYRASEALRALLDRAEKAEAEAARWAASDTVALFNAAAGATTAIAHALDDGDVRDSSSGQLEASLNALNDALARPSAPETLAWAVVGEDGELRVSLTSRHRPETWELPDGERVVRVAIRVVEGEE